VHWLAYLWILPCGDAHKSLYVRHTAQHFEIAYRRVNSRMRGDYLISHPGRLLCGLLDPVNFFSSSIYVISIMVVGLSPHELYVVLLFPGFDAQSQVYGV